MTTTATAGKFATKVLVGPADVWIAPTGTAMPTLPPSGILSTPVTPWFTTGETTDGVVFQYSRKVNDIRTETQSTPVDKTVTTSTVTVTLTFAQDTLLSMKLAYGGGTITKVAAAADTPGYSKLTLSNSLDKLALVLIGKNVEGLDRVIYIPKVVSVGKVKTSYLRAKSARSYPASFDALCTVATIPIIDITAAASGTA